MKQEVYCFISTVIQATNLYTKYKIYLDGVY